MRCFRVDEVAVAGISLSTVEDGLCIEVGDKKVPIDQHLAKGLTSTRYTILSKLRECLDSGKTEGRELTEAELNYIEMIEGRIETENLALMYADVERDRVVQEKRRSPDALVLVETGAGIDGGSIAFKSTSFDEMVDQTSKRVRREYKVSFPPPGVRVIEEGITKLGEKSYLLQMIPKSSFRIERTGPLPSGASNVLTVVWKGKGSAGVPPLEVFAPRHYSK